MPRGITARSPGVQVQDAALGAQAHTPGRWQQHHLGVGILEVASVHRGTGAIQVDGQAASGTHVAVPDIARHAVEKVDRGGRLRPGRPSALGMWKAAVT